jgi:hypothetical protein
MATQPKFRQVRGVNAKQPVWYMRDAIRYTSVASSGNMPSQKLSLEYDARGYRKESARLRLSVVLNDVTGLASRSGMRQAIRKLNMDYRRAGSVNVFSRAGIPDRLRLTQRRIDSGRMAYIKTAQVLVFPPRSAGNEIWRDSNVVDNVKVLLGGMRRFALRCLC